MKFNITSIFVSTIIIALVSLSLVQIEVFAQDRAQNEISFEVVNKDLVSSAETNQLDLKAAQDLGSNAVEFRITATNIEIISFTEDPTASDLLALNKKVENNVATMDVASVEEKIKTGKKLGEIKYKIKDTNYGAKFTLYYKIPIENSEAIIRESTFTVLEGDELPSDEAENNDNVIVFATLGVMVVAILTIVFFIKKSRGGDNKMSTASMH